MQAGRLHHWNWVGGGRPPGPVHYRGKAPGRFTPSLGGHSMPPFTFPSHLLLLTLLAMLPAAPAYAQGQKDPDAKTRQLELDAKLRQLEKEIAAVRGLAFKAPVDARIIPRPQGKDKGLQGYYSPKEKRLYLFNDLSGAYERGVLIHEMVHALQDQHFGLQKLHQ